MDQTPDQQQQPIYPQQYQQPYPPQPYPVFYYPPQPPKKKDDKKLIILIMAVVFVMIVLPVILSIALYMMIMNVEPPDFHRVPVGDWGDVRTISSTSVEVDFTKLSPEPRPGELEIMLGDMNRTGVYGFWSNDDGPLVLMSGSNVGTLTYVDLADNQRVNEGDSILMTDLQPDTEYTLYMIWSATGNLIAVTTFSTPA